MHIRVTQLWKYLILQSLHMIIRVYTCVHIYKYIYTTYTHQIIYIHGDIDIMRTHSYIRYLTLRYVTLQCRFNCITLQYIHCITLHDITLHYITHIQIYTYKYIWYETVQMANKTKTEDIWVGVVARI